MRIQMSQPLAAMGVLTITTMVSAVVSAWFTPRLVAIRGTGAVVAFSCALTGLALWGFSIAPSFGWLVLLPIPLGACGGAVDASIDHCVAANYTSRHMNWLHGFWGSVQPQGQRSWVWSSPVLKLGQLAFATSRWRS